MNREYILHKIKPYLDSEKRLSEDDFKTLFSMLSKVQQYRVIDILIEEDIEIDYEHPGHTRSTQVTLQPDPLTTRPSSLSTQPSTPRSHNLKINKLTNEQLCILYQKGNKFALEALVKKNIKLVWSRAYKYGKRYKHKLDYEDLVQYGTMGLIKAAERFQMNKEAKFTTYAIWWIDQIILRSIADYGFTIRLPVHYFEQINKVLRIFAKNTGSTKQEIFELLEKDGMSREKFEELLAIVENVLSLTSLNSFIGEDEDTELGEFLIDKTNPTVEEIVEEKALKEAIAEVLGTLSPRERDIIEQRFGLKDGIVRTLEQVAVNYQVTRERIRQIEVKAIKRLRHPSRSRLLRDFLEG